MMTLLSQRVHIDLWKGLKYFYKHKMTHKIKNIQPALESASKKYLKYKNILDSLVNSFANRIQTLHISLYKAIVPSYSNE